MIGNIYGEGKRVSGEVQNVSKKREREKESWKGESRCEDEEEETKKYK